MKSFKPSLNVGYSPNFSSFLNQKVTESQGKPENNYRKYYSCLQRKSKEEYDRTGENGWAGGFVKKLFDDMATKRPCNSTMEKECSIIFDFPCRVELGFNHLSNELVPNFFDYAVDPSVNFENWDNKHDNFLDLATKPCFNEVYGDLPVFCLPPDLLCRWKSLDYTMSFFITYGSGWFIREWAQFSFSANKIFSSKWVNVFNNRPSTLQTVPIPLPIPKEYLYSSQIENSSSLKVKSDTTFYLLTNRTIQLSTTYVNEAGITVDITNSNSGTVYTLSVDTTIASISLDGLLKIKSTPMPFVNGRFPLKVLATNNEKVGIGQFAIIDSDLDNDLIADSYETRIGLNPDVPNLGDLDDDYLLDFYEAMRGSNPLKKDSDNDGFSDVIELQKGTNLTNADSFPLPIESIASGTWNSTSTWSCNCIPTISDAVIINEGHKIQIPNSLQAECNTILIKQGAIFEAPNSTIFKVFNR